MTQDLKNRRENPTSAKVDVVENRPPPQRSPRRGSAAAFIARNSGRVDETNDTITTNDGTGTATHTRPGTVADLLKVRGGGVITAKATDRVRETLFNWLGQDLSGWRILDAFAGTGALGLEAASRGADEVCLLEREPALVRALLATQARLKATQVQVLQVDALNWMNQRQRAGHFDLVFLDPPFEADCFAPALAAASHCVAVGGWVYLEADHTFSDEDAAVLCAGLRRHRHGQAGAVHFHLFQRVAEESHTGVPQV